MRIDENMYDLIFNWLSQIEKGMIVTRHGGVGMSKETLIDILENGQNYKEMLKNLKERNELIDG